MINAVSSLLFAAGERMQSEQLLRDAYHNFSWRGDLGGLSAARFGHNLGHALLKRGDIRPKERDDEPHRWFFMAQSLVPRANYQAPELLCRFLRGEKIHFSNQNTGCSLVEEASQCASSLKQQIAAGEGGLVTVDSCFAIVELLEFLGAGEYAQVLLEGALRLSASAGDFGVPRRAGG